MKSWVGGTLVVGFHDRWIEMVLGDGVGFLKERLMEVVLFLLVDVDMQSLHAVLRIVKCLNEAVCALMGLYWFGILV